MTQLGFYYDNTRCTGCKTCLVACENRANKAPGVTHRKVYDIEGGEWKDQGDGSYTTNCFFYHLSLSCNHCDNPACIAVCPTAALYKDAQTGLVLVNKDVCDGCGCCAHACPYHAPGIAHSIVRSVACSTCSSETHSCSRSTDKNSRHLDAIYKPKQVQKGYCAKCDGCYERVRVGKLPLCVEACPLRALEFGPIDVLRNEHTEGIDRIHPMPDSAITQPNIVINPSPAALSPVAKTGVITNLAEINPLP